MDLTPEQRAVVDAGDLDIVVTAGAGSGKTHVLVERYIALLERCRVAEVAAVTFTEAAAAEMRQRVRREILTREGLSAQRADVDEAVIGTIHAFSRRLLRDHPVESGIDPATAVLAEDEAELLRRAASAAAIDEAAASDDARVEVLRAFGVYWINQLLPSMVAEREDVARAFDALGPDAGMAAALRARLDARCEELVRPLRSIAIERLRAARDLAIAPRDRLVQTVETAYLACVRDREADWLTLTDTLRETIAVGLRFNVGSKTAWAGGKAEIVRDLTSLRESVRGCLDSMPAWNESDELAVAAMPGLRALFEDACRRYEGAKSERAGIDFLDLELHAVRLLQTESVRAAVRRRFRHLMVDEAQDVSPLQARLVRLLIEGPGEGPRLLLVGDEKQSIYAFRGADVRQFRELRDLAIGRGGVRLDLSRSFRTHRGLVGHTNALFAAIFTGDGAPAMTAMTGRPAAAPPGPHLIVTPLTVERGAEETPRRRLAEAALVAADIEGLLGSGRPVWDKRTESYRPVRRGDIAVLLRRFKNVHLFEQALEARSIDYATPSGTGFFSRQEVLDLENLLRWLAEPDDDIALVGVLRSPLFIIADDVLFRLRETGRPLVAALDDPPPAIEGDDRARCRFAADVLGGLRHAASTWAPVDLLERALESTGFEASWAAVTGGEQALANIRKLVRIVRSLPGFSLSEVAEYLLQRREDLDAREGPAVLDRLDAVQIMTVHGAKGLEFPVVFVPEAHTKPWEQAPTVLWRRDEGISFTLERGEGDERRRRPAFYDHLRTLSSADDREEHLRLFYVAATRAGDYLYLSGDAEQAGGWLAAVQAASAAGNLNGIEVRDEASRSELTIAYRAAPTQVQVPERQQAFVPPLLARPPVIPLRSSTPVTALRIEEPHRGGRGDGLGLIRGRIAHRAIEARYGSQTGADLATIAAQEAAEAPSDVRGALVNEVEMMLDRFARSEVAAGLASPDARPRFELPFAWDWDGIPVHGQIDLLYHSGTGWRVVDFKTDRVPEPGLEAEVEAAAQSYLVQIGLYARAIEAATGRRPEAGLLYLRTGRWYEPPWGAVEAAMASARRRIDRGLLLDPELTEYLGGDNE